MRPLRPPSLLLMRPLRRHGPCRSAPRTQRGRDGRVGREAPRAGRRLAVALATPIYAAHYISFFGIGACGQLVRAVQYSF